MNVNKCMSRFVVSEYITSNARLVFFFFRATLGVSVITAIMAVRFAHPPSTGLTRLAKFTAAGKNMQNIALF